MTQNGNGYFPPGTVLREVHEQRAVGLFYGQRALGIGALNPVNFIGTALHTQALDRPFQRLVKTAKMFETIFLGSRADADRVLQTVHNLHQKVQGELPVDAGPYPAGTHYSAYDPDLMLWTVAVIADSARFFYELFVRRLSEAEREELWQGYVRFGELFGMPRDAVPGSHREFQAYWDERLHSDESYLTEDARYVGSAIMFQIPVPPAEKPAMRFHNLIVLGSLPPRARELYGLDWTASQERAFRAVVATSRMTRSFTPRRLRTGWNTAFFDRVAKAERALGERGVPIPGAISTGPDTPLAAQIRPAARV